MLKNRHRREQRLPVQLADGLRRDQVLPATGGRGRHLHVLLAVLDYLRDRHGVRVHGGARDQGQDVRGNSVRARRLFARVQTILRQILKRKLENCHSKIIPKMIQSKIQSKK